MSQGVHKITKDFERSQKHSKRNRILKFYGFLLELAET